jgi:hypothetical protein
MKSEIEKLDEHFAIECVRNERGDPEAIYVLHDGARVAHREGGKWVAKSGYEVWDEDD